MQRFYLLRHGETDYNLQGIVQGGGIDADLNATGRTQGQRFFQHHRHRPFDKVFCTGLKRTRQTIEFFEQEDYDLQEVPALNEMDWGVMEGVKGNAFIQAEFHRLNAAWEKGELDVAVEKGESPLQAWERSHAGIMEVQRQLPEDGTALVCIHGRIMRILLAGLLGYGLKRMNLFPHHNTGLNVLVRTPGGKWYAERLNDLSHLSA